MKNFKDCCKELSEKINDKLTHISYEGDLSDIGNEIGIIIAKYVYNSDIDLEELDYFIDGIKHGISLIDGTHDNLKRKSKI